MDLANPRHNTPTRTKTHTKHHLYELGQQEILKERGHTTHIQLIAILILNNSMA